MCNYWNHVSQLITTDFRGNNLLCRRVDEGKMQTRHLSIADKLNYDVNYGDENNIICSVSVKDMLACGRER